MNAGGALKFETAPKCHGVEHADEYRCAEPSLAARVVHTCGLTFELRGASRARTIVGYRSVAE